MDITQIEKINSGEDFLYSFGDILLHAGMYPVVAPSPEVFPREELDNLISVLEEAVRAVRIELNESKTITSHSTGALSKAEILLYNFLYRNYPRGRSKIGYAHNSVRKLKDAKLGSETLEDYQ